MMFEYHLTRYRQLNREMWYEKIPPGKKGVAFTVAQRQRFNNVTISICKYKEINEHDEREVFQVGFLCHLLSMIL